MKFVERRASDSGSEDERPGNMYFDHCYTPKNFNAVFGLPTQAQCFQITSTTGECTHPIADFNASTSSIIEASFPNAYRAENGTYYLTPSTTVSPAVNYRSNNNKYKSSIMEKYLRDLEVDPPESDPNAASMAVIHAVNPFQQTPQGPSGCQLSCELRGPPSLSKWLESTAKFTPSKNNYIDWDQPGKPSSVKKRCDSHSSNHQLHHVAQTSPQSNPEYGTSTIHQKDEIDAAEALTRLANNFRMKFYT